MIRTLVVDDSPTARGLIIGILRTDPDFEIVGEASDGQEAVRMTRELRPDLVTMDIQMPLMDGLTATQAIMSQAPTPIIVISNLDVEEVKVSLNALRAGALMVLQKPAGPASPDFKRASHQIVATAKAMSRVRTLLRTTPQGPPTAPLPLPAPHGASGPSVTPKIVALAASTGGPKALQTILAALPRDFPVPVLVVQHIAHGFVQGLASWLDEASPLKVKVAEAGEPLKAGVVYVAPDDRHLGVSPQDAVLLSDAPPIGPFRPSATFTFDSVGRVYGAASVGVILTGIGADGVEGLRTVRREQGFILAQDKESSVLFGMPEAAIEARLPDVVVSLTDVAPALVRATSAGS